jgi:DNA-binding SARP family transcriptional activator
VAETMNAARLSIYSLGPFEVEVSGRPSPGVSGGKMSALLMLLAMRPGHRYSREDLADMLWPGLPIQPARDNLRHTFFHLREALSDGGGEPYLLFGRDWLSFNDQSDHWLDARELAEVEPKRLNLKHDPAKAERAIALYRGEFMAGFSLPDCQGFERWLRGRREDLGRRAVMLLEHLVHHHEESGGYDRCLEFARRLLALDPLNESFHRHSQAHGGGLLAHFGYPEAREGAARRAVAAALAMCRAAAPAPFAGAGGRPPMGRLVLARSAARAGRATEERARLDSSHRPPGIRTSVVDSSGALTLELEHLPEKPVRQLAERLSSGLPPEQLQRIVAQADGVPLFIEELARWQGGSKDRAQSNVPTTLHDLLMARIEQLGSARRLAQVGASCGRDFEPKVLAAALKEEGVDVERGIQDLLRSGLVLEGKGWLRFKHALIQEAAYESQSRWLRRETHGRIAAILERDFPNRCRNRLETLAHHLTDAREIEPAIRWWRAAGAAAARCWSHHEAVLHLRKALELMAELAPSRERDKQELSLRVAGRAPSREGGPPAVAAPRCSPSSWATPASSRGSKSLPQAAPTCARRRAPPSWSMRAMSRSWSVAGIAFLDGDSEMNGQVRGPSDEVRDTQARRRGDQPGMDAAAGHRRRSGLAQGLRGGDRPPGSVLARIRVAEILMVLGQVLQQGHRSEAQVPSLALEPILERRAIGKRKAGHELAAIQSGQALDLRNLGRHGPRLRRGELPRVNPEIASGIEAQPFAAEEEEGLFAAVAQRLAQKKEGVPQVLAGRLNRQARPKHVRQHLARIAVVRPHRQDHQQRRGLPAAQAREGATRDFDLQRSQ